MNYEYELEGNYGYGWDLLIVTDTKAKALEQKRCYQENESGVAYRIKRVKASV